MPVDKTDIPEIAQQVRNYLLMHPNAADSLHGVLRWWLPRQRYEESLDKMQQALEYLIAEGVVAKKILVGGEIVYESTTSTSAHS